MPRPCPPPPRSFPHPPAVEINLLHMLHMSEGPGTEAPGPFPLIRDDQLAGQLASMLLSISSVLPPTIHAVASVQNVPEPTAPGIWSPPSKRKMSELASSSANDASSGSVIFVGSVSLRGESSEWPLAIARA